MSSGLTFGAYLAKKRKAIGMTQEELSAALEHRGLGRAASTVSNWEADRQLPPPDAIKAIAEILNESSPAQLFSLAGLLDNIPGKEIVLLLDGHDAADIETAERLIRALFQSK